MRKLLLTLALLPALACASHEKAGDRAAAMGDWRTAVANYQRAVGEDPDDEELREKYAQAKREGRAASWARAQSCAASNDWECAVSEVDFALSIDPADRELNAFRANAGRSAGLARVERARQASAQGQHAEALTLLKGAVAISSDPSVGQAATRARPELVERATVEAQRLRAGGALAEAVALLDLVVELDGAKRPLAEQVRAEYEQYREAEYQRLAAEGDGALAAHDFAAAADRYEAALRVKPGGRAQPLARYSRLLLRGEAAKGHRDWAGAAQAYREAMATGQDASGYAAQQIEAVEVRPYRISIRSLYVAPVRPDGQPWVGRPNKVVLRAKSATVRLFGVGVDVGGGHDRYVQLTRGVPEENYPTLCLEAVLPDGRKLRTEPKKGLYAAYDAEFVVVTNAFDDRRLNMRVAHDPSGACAAMDIGTVDVPIGEIVGRKALRGASALVNVDLFATPAPGGIDGSFSGMSPVPVAGPPAAPAPGTYPPPQPGAAKPHPARPAGRR